MQNNLLFDDLLKILKEDFNKNFLKSILNDYLTGNPHNQIVTDYIYGITRHKILLENLIFNFVKKQGIKKEELHLFLIAFYSITFRDSTNVPVFTNDFIEYIKNKYNLVKSKFFNGVIRNYLRKKEELLKNLKENQKDVYYSVPKGLFDYISSNFDDKKKDILLNQMVKIPKFYFRINSSFKDDKEILKEFNIYENIYQLKTNSFSSIKEYLENKSITIQDISSQIACYSLNPKESDKILDLCSAPGTKSSLLAELTNDKANIYSVELNADKFEKMKFDLLNYQSIDSINKDASKPLREKNFDKIMIDAPCSALGTISKNPDKKYKFDLTEINNYSQIQLEILNNGFKHLKKGGELIYVVCTFTKEETTNVIDEFLKQNNDAKEVEFTTFDNKFTGKRLNTEMFYDGDIFFIAKIKKE